MLRSTLESLRGSRRTRTVALAGVVAGLLGAPLSLVPIGSKAHARPVRLDRVVAVVGPSIILESDLNRELKLSPLIAARLAEFTRRPTPSEIAEIQRELRPKILETLIGDQLVLLEAQKYPSLALSDGELEAYLLNIAKGNQMQSVDELRREVERSGDYGSWSQYKDTMRRQVGVYKIEVSLVPVPDVTETEIRAHYRELGQGEEASVKARRWVFPSQAEAQAHLTKLGQTPNLEGESMEFTRGASAPALEDALFKAAANDRVGPIQIGRNWLVFAVDEVRESKLAAYETVKDQLRAKLEQARRSRATAQYREKLRANNHVEIRN